MRTCLSFRKNQRAGWPFYSRFQRFWSSVTSPWHIPLMRLRDQRRIPQKLLRNHPKLYLRPTWTTMDFQTQPNSELSTTARTFVVGSRGSLNCNSTNSAINGTQSNATAPAWSVSPGVRQCGHMIVHGSKEWAKTTIPSRQT